MTRRTLRPAARSQAPTALRGGWLALWLAFAGPGVATAQESTPAPEPTATDTAPAAVPGEAEPAAGAAPAESPYDPEALTRDLVEATQWLARERERNTLLTDAIRAADASGIRLRLRAAEAAEVTRRSVMLDALRRNLSVQRGALGVGVAEAALIEAEALFDPVVALGYTHSQLEDFERIERPDRFRRATQPIIDQNGAVHDAIVFEDGIIEYIGFDRPRPDTIAPFTEFASESSLTGSDTRNRYSLALSQALPWGANLALTYSLLDHKTYFVNDAGARRAGLTTFGGYDLPWTASVSGSLFLPLPWTRNFGEYSAREVSIRLADLAYRRAGHTASRVINDTLLSIDLAFFDLTRATLAVEITLSNLEQVDKLRARTERLLQAELITAHNKAQVDAEYERVAAQVETTWAAWARASNALNQLTDQDAGRLNLPLGYSGDLTAPVTFAVDPAEVRDATRNPEYLARSQDLEAAVVRARQAENDARPDLTGDITVALAQNDQPFGYGGVEEAVAETFDPDSKSLSAGVTLLRPWGNRGARAARDAAALDVGVQEALLRRDLNRLNLELDNALVDHASARLRADIAARSVALTRIAYDKALEAQSSRMVTEFEIVTQNRELLDANLVWVDTLVGVKQAESRVLAAAGLLPERYGDQTALSELDRLRLVAVSRSHPLRFFGGDPR